VFPCLPPGYKLARTSAWRQGLHLHPGATGGTIPCGKVFITNAVKHFTFVPQGKKRLHKRPNAGEILRCKWWLGQERKPVWPGVMVAMGATALRSSPGRATPVSSVRGQVKTLEGPDTADRRHPSFPSFAYPGHRGAAARARRFHCRSPARVEPAGRWTRRARASSIKGSGGEHPDVNQASGPDIRPIPGWRRKARCGHATTYMTMNTKRRTGSGAQSVASRTRTAMMARAKAAIPPGAFSTR